MNDHYRRTSAPPGHPAQDQDPLAELARLIGRAETAPDYSATPEQTLAQRLAAASLHQRPAAEWPPQPDYSAGAPRGPAAAQGYEHPNPHYAPAPGHPPHGVPANYAAPSHAPAQQPSPGHPDYRAQTYADAAAGYRNAVPHHPGFPPQAAAHRELHSAGANPYQPPHEASGYAAAHDSHGYQPDPYYREDGRRPAQEEEIYDDAPQHRRHATLMIVAALLSLAVVGTAGAFAYRSFFGASRTAGPPPVIKADTTPAKVVPAVQASDAQTNKLIQDRLVGNTAQGERLVSREERPIEMRDPRPPAPRAVFPPVTATSDVITGAANAGQGSAAAPAIAEPKRVRTVTIRPDQPDVVPRDQASEPPSTASAAAPRATSPRPAPAPAVQPQRNGPLSLSPQPASQPRPQQRPAALAPTQLAAAAPVAAAAGNYLVQVSSQRSEADAQASFRSLQAQFPNHLGSRSAIIRRADLGDRGIYYRSMVGPFASAEDAVQFCTALKAAGGQCLIQRN